LMSSPHHCLPTFSLRRCPTWRRTFARITAAQLGFLTAEAAHGLTADQLTQLNDTAAVGFTDGQIANLNPEACKGIFSHTWLNIPAPLFANVTVQCVQNARDDFLVSVTRAQLAYFNAAQVNALSQNQRLSSLPPPLPA